MRAVLTIQRKNLPGITGVSWYSVRCLAVVTALLNIQLTSCAEGGEPMPVPGEFAAAADDHFELKYTMDVEKRLPSSACDTTTVPSFRRDFAAADLFRPVRASDTQLTLFPSSQLFGTYIAGPKEPRMQMLWMSDSKSDDTYGDAVLGGRAGIFHLTGRDDSFAEQFQLDLDGAVFARILPFEDSAELTGSDYLVALWGTWRTGPLALRTGYRHLSSHLGDEFLLLNPGYPRRNYVRDSLLLAMSYDIDEQFRVYGEYGYAFGVGGGAKPNECQFGGEWIGPREQPTAGAPFSAVHVQFREEQKGDAGFNLSAGWGWRADENGRHLRVGLNYYRGPSLQYSFTDVEESLIGGGVWLDF